MKKPITFVGLDVHSTSIALAMLPPEVPIEREIPNDPTLIRRTFTRLKAETEQLRCCYEAGPCGFELYRLLTAMGIPVRSWPPPSFRRSPATASRPTGATPASSSASPAPANSPRFGCPPLTRRPCAIWSAPAKTSARTSPPPATGWPSSSCATAGSLPQARSGPSASGAGSAPRPSTAPPSRSPSSTTCSKSTKERRAALEREIGAVAEAAPYQPAVARLACLRGISTLSAMTVLAEVQDFRRFKHPRQLMAFLGLVPSEHSSGPKQHRGGIAKTGNTHARRILIEAAWAYRHPPALGPRTRRLLAAQPPEVVVQVRKAQLRLHKRYARLVGRGKRPPVAVTAVARELCGFVRALMTHAAA